MIRPEIQFPISKTTDFTPPVAGQDWVLVLEAR